MVFTDEERVCHCMSSGRGKSIPELLSGRSRGLFKLFPMSTKKITCVSLLIALTVAFIALVCSQPAAAAKGRASRMNVVKNIVQRL